MGSVLEALPAESRVAILRLRSLGDCVLTTPALRILTLHRPDLQIAVAVEDRFRAVFEDHPGVAAILPPSWRAVRKWRPRLCLNLHGGSRSARMIALSGARYSAGFAHFRHQYLYNVRIPRAQEILGVDRVVHTAEHLASAIFFLGAPAVDIPSATLYAPPAPKPERPIAVIHAFASAPSKSWTSSGFLDVAEHLRRSGMDPVFIGGPGDDLAPFHEFRTVSSAPLRDIKQLLAGASLFIGNDSGPAHMAAAFHLPALVLFADSDPAIWGPWRTPAEIVIAPRGMSQLSSAEVLDALARLKVHA